MLSRLHGSLDYSGAEPGSGSRDIEGPQQRLAAMLSAALGGGRHSIQTLPLEALLMLLQHQLQPAAGQWQTSGGCSKTRRGGSGSSTSSMACQAGGAALLAAAEEGLPAGADGAAGKTSPGGFTCEWGLDTHSLRLAAQELVVSACWALVSQGYQCCIFAVVGAA